jgi:hypothetical protein
VTPVDDNGGRRRRSGTTVFSGCGSNWSLTCADADVNGKPIGLAFTLRTGSSCNGSIVVILRHEPLKSAAGVASGSITNAGGATDAQITQFRLNSILAKKELSEKRYLKSSVF